MPTYGPLTLNKHRNIGQLTYEQVDSNWDELEEVVNEIGGDLSFQFPNDNLIATSDPTVNDDSSAGYSKFSRWYNSTNQTLWALTDPTVGAAVWVDTGWEYFQLGSASIAQIGTGPTEVPINNMLGTCSSRNVLAGVGDIPVTDSVVLWTSQHTFSVNNASEISSASAGFTAFQQIGAGASGIAFEAGATNANLGIDVSGELRFGGGTVSGSSYLIFHEGNAATSEELIEGLEAKPLTIDTIYPANAPLASTGLGEFAPDFAEGRAFSRELTGNSTLADPSNAVAGMSGLIILTVDATGGYTFSTTGTSLKFIGGVPTLSMVANAKNVLTYYVESPTSIIMSYLGVAS